MTTPSPQPDRLIAGCMTGTSIDSLDAALVRVRGRGMSIKAELVRTLNRPLGDLGSRLRALADQHPMTAGQIAVLSRDFSLLHLAALKELVAKDPADLVSIHGQTVFHAPPLSWQLLTPAVIAHGLGVPVVSDLRAADLARGGQGAPITPIADHILFRGHTHGSTAIVNLGGFCNITILPQPGEPDGMEALAAAQAIVGLDLCACNHVLDGIARDLFNTPFDAGGARAARGQVHREAILELGEILGGQQRGGRSLGTGDESHAWIARWNSRVAPDDLAATACEAIAQAIAAKVGGISLILLAGGGVKNNTLVKAIRSCCSSRVEPTDAFGIPADYREAAEMAVLGALCQDRVPITLPQVTGATSPAPIAGTWVYP